MRTWVDLSEGLSLQRPCPFVGAIAQVRERRRLPEASPEVADRAHRTTRRPQKQRRAERMRESRRLRRSETLCLSGG